MLKLYTSELIDVLRPEEVIKLHGTGRYEATISAKMMKSLGKTIIGAYSKAVSDLLPVDATDELFDDLNDDPVVGNSLGVLAREIYGTFGNYFAPVATLIITATHIQFPE